MNGSLKGRLSVSGEAGQSEGLVDLGLTPFWIVALLPLLLRPNDSETPRLPPEPPLPPPLPEKLREQFAYHEASHAVAAHVLGVCVARIEINASGGRTAYQTSPDVLNTRRMISISLAGTIGERMKDPLFQGLPYAVGGDLSDQRLAVSIADRFTKNLEDRRVELQRARNCASLILAAHWPAVRAVAETLIEISEYGDGIDGSSVRQIIASVTPTEAIRSDHGKVTGSDAAAAMGQPSVSDSLRRKRRSRDWN